MRTQANSAICNFFALLKDDTVRKNRLTTSDNK